MTVNKNKNVEFKFEYKTFASYKIIITLLLNMNKFEKKDFKGHFFFFLQKRTIGRLQ